MIIVSMLMFARLMQRLGDLQIGNVLHLVGDRGRAVIGDMFRPLGDASAAPRASDAAANHARLGPATQTVKYSGKPRTIASLDVERPRRAGAAGGRDDRDGLRGRRHPGRGRGSSACSRGGDAAAGRRAPAAPFASGANAPSSRTRNTRSGFSSTSPSRRLSPAINDPTTAVQTIDQLEDLLRRLGAAELDAGYAVDENGVLRLVFPTPTWEDYLTLAFDEIRQFGSNSVQVMRRLRSALVGLADSLPNEERVQAVRRYLEHLDRAIETSSFDVEDRRTALAGGPAGHRPVAAARGYP